MYTLNLPVSTLRTKMRQEFERHRYVNQLKTVDVLLFNSHQEFQVPHPYLLSSHYPRVGIGKTPRPRNRADGEGVDRR